MAEELVEDFEAEEEEEEREEEEEEDDDDDDRVEDEVGVYELEDDRLEDDHVDEGADHEEELDVVCVCVTGFT